MQVYVRVKTLGKRKDALQLMPYELPDSVGSLRQLITAFVEYEVERYNQKEADAHLMPWLTAQQVDDMVETGKVGFGGIFSDHKADREHAIENAIQCCEDGMVRVLMDGTELTEPDAPLTVREGAVFTFIRLTFLAGRMW